MSTLKASPLLYVHGLAATGTSALIVGSKRVRWVPVNCRTPPRLTEKFGMNAA
jgi:hypothetical protein